jgi:hypothetical protein
VGEGKQGALNMVTCPLCADNRVSAFHEDRSREYLRCATCRLIFVRPEFHLSPADEKAEYDLHQNSPDDQGYRRFLGRLFEPVNALLTPESSGLDFGSGPGPTLSVMFEEAGHEMAIFDPFYAPDPSSLTRQYEFATASEVLEHLRRPAEDLHRLWSCVKPGGLLGIMTKQARDQASFASWHYKNDRTHVSFFSRETLEWLAVTWHAEPSFIGTDVVLFSKSDGTESRR